MRSKLTSERFIWATQVLNIQPGDRILEIGCGAGLFAEQMIKKLGSGNITAVDRSASMINLSSKKNAAAVAAGRAKFVHFDFMQSDFKKNRFDKIVAFNVNFFWKDSKDELQVIRHIMKPAGQLFVFYQAPTWLREEAADPIKKNLQENFFELTGSVFEQMRPTPVFCIKARPKK